MARRLWNASVEGVRDTFIPSQRIKGSDAVTTTGESRTRFFAPVIDVLRTLHSASRNARAEAQKTTSALFRNLTRDEYQLVKEYVFLRDAHENITRGMEFRPGFDEPSVLGKLNQLQARVNANPDVRIALKGYKDLINTTRDMLVAEGISHRLDREWYFPHTVLDFTNLMGSGKKFLGVNIPRLSSKGLRYSDPRSTKERVGSARDISTNLIDQLENYLTDVNTQVEKRRQLMDLGERFDVRSIPNYKDKYGNTVAHVTSADQIPPGFVKWDPNKGTSRLRASSIMERYLGEMMDYGSLDALAQHLNIDPVEFKLALDDVGISNPAEAIERYGASLLPAKGKVYIIPEEMKITMDKAIDQMNNAETMGLSEGFVRGWKSIVLNMAPIRYNFRNLLGDGQRMYAQFGNEAMDPTLWRDVIRSTHQYYSKGIIDPLMQQMLDHGITSANRIQSEYLLSNVDPHLKALEHGPSGVGLRSIVDKIDKAMSWIPERSGQREDIVRGVLMEMNNRRLASGKELLTGVADKELVQGLLDAGMQERAVSYIARKSLLDYGDFTPRENTWRNGWFPFYAWASGNFSFWGKLGSDLAKNGLKGGGATPLARASTMAMARGAATTAVVLSTVRLWNEKVMGDWEEQMPKNIRSTTHFVLPDYDHWQKTGEYKPSFDEEGKVRYWSTRDALDDFMTYLGLDTAIPEAFSVARGTLSKDEYIRRQREYAGFGGVVPGKAALRSVLGQIGPREQILGQLVFGKRTFPDALHPADIPAEARAGAVRDVFGLSAIPGIEGVLGGMSAGTDIFQPATKLYNVPKQLGFSSAREPSIYLNGQMKDPQKEGLTPYEADLVSRISQKKAEVAEEEGTMARERSMQSNRQLDQSTREANFAARRVKIDEIITEIKELTNRFTTLQRTRRFNQANPR